MPFLGRGALIFIKNYGIIIKKEQKMRSFYAFYLPFSKKYSIIKAENKGVEIKLWQFKEKLPKITSF